MKKFRIPLVVLMLGICLGWIVGYLNFSMFEQEDAFWLGGLFMIAFILLIQLAIKLNGRKKSAHSFIRKFLVFIVACCLVLVGWFASEYWKSFQPSRISDVQSHFILEQEKAIQSIQTEAYLAQLNNLYNAIDLELSTPNSDTLSQSLIDRIVAVSRGLKPYRYLIADSLTKEKLSPERGQLLTTLCKMKIDSLSFEKIKRNADFSFADLSEVDLSSVDLSYANLEQANFKQAKLSGSKWKETNLYLSNFWGANLSNVNFHKTRLVRANFAWTVLDHSKIDSSFMNGIVLKNAKLKKVIFQNTSMRWAEIEGATFKEAQLIHTDLAHSYLDKSNFDQANLIEVNLRKVKLGETNFSNSKLEKIIVVEGWLSELSINHCIGIDHILEHYQIVEGKSQKFERAKYFLVKK